MYQILGVPIVISWIYLEWRLCCLGSFLNSSPLPSPLKLHCVPTPQKEYFFPYSFISSVENFCCFLPPDCYLVWRSLGRTLCLIVSSSIFHICNTEAGFLLSLISYSPNASYKQKVKVYGKECDESPIMSAIPWISLLTRSHSHPWVVCF